jgi:hypothetical protein
LIILPQAFWHEVRSSTEQDARPAASTLEAAGKKASGILNQVNMAGKQFSAFMPESLRMNSGLVIAFRVIAGFFG